MCGRYTLIQEPSTLIAEFECTSAVWNQEQLSAPVARYNIAPSQLVPVVRLDERGNRCLDNLRWGLIPHWAKGPEIGFRTINARCETLSTQPSFRDAFKSKRCIVPVSGFFEWQKLAGGRKQPYYIQLANNRPMALAGLWDRWVAPDGTTIESFTIVTTNSNELVRPLHDRMPVILRPDHYKLWLSTTTPISDLNNLFNPFPGSEMITTPVSMLVNDTRNDEPLCIAPVEPERDLFSGI